MEETPKQLAQIRVVRLVVKTKRSAIVQVSCKLRCKAPAGLQWQHQQSIHYILASVAALHCGNHRGSNGQHPAILASPSGMQAASPCDITFAFCSEVGRVRVGIFKDIFSMPVTILGRLWIPCGLYCPCMLSLIVEGRTYGDHDCLHAILCLCTTLVAG